MQFYASAKQAVIAFLLVVGSAAHGGTHHVREAATRELACYESEKAANSDAKAAGTCYHPCDRSKCTPVPGGFKCDSVSANHEKSCRKKPKSYVRSVDPAQFPPPPGTQTTPAPKAEAVPLKVDGTENPSDTTKYEHRRHGSPVACEGRGRWWARRALRHALDVEGGPQGGLHVALQAHPCLARATGCRELLERGSP